LPSSESVLQTRKSADPLRSIIKTHSTDSQMEYFQALGGWSATV